jgi:hypothetical protein
MSIECAGFRQLWFRPKCRSAFFAGQVVSLFHFQKGFHDRFATGD